GNPWPRDAELLGATGESVADAAEVPRGGPDARVGKAHTPLQTTLRIGVPGSKSQARCSRSTMLSAAISGTCTARLATRALSPAGEASALSTSGASAPTHVAGMRGERAIAS